MEIKSDICNWYTQKFGVYTYLIFRILVGLIFFFHGTQKLFGWFGGLSGSGDAVTLFNLIGLAGIIETFGGLAIIVGVLTRLVGCFRNCFRNVNSLFYSTYSTRMEPIIK